MTDSRAFIIALNAQLKAAQEAYYAGNPTMPDAEYDALEIQLKSMIDVCPEFAPLATVLVSVGDATENSAVRIPHLRPMRSIENFYTVDSFTNATKNYGPVVLVEDKNDGVSCELAYEDGKLVQAVTRGDGAAGEDMTMQVKALRKVPQTIPYKSSLRIRGEMVMRNSELTRINALGGKQYSNTRNLVSGTLKQLDLNIVQSREIIFLPWDLYSPSADNALSDSAYERMKFAETLGFEKFTGELVPVRNLALTLEKFLKNLEGSDITADGVVVKTDSHKLRSKLGFGKKYTAWQHCFKPQNLAAETKMIGIEYQLGRTGKITPVAILNPVNLGGAIVSRANLVNETFMENLGIRVGAVVSVLRSGNVIPYITGVVDVKNSTPVVFPTVCPSCKTPLKYDTSDLIVQRYCENAQCAGRAAETFVFVGKRETLEIDVLGDSLAAELVANGITDLASLFEFGNESHTVSKLAGCFRSGVNTMKMIKSLTAAKTADWSRWFACMGIVSIGHSLGKDIAIELNLTSEDMLNLPTLLTTLSQKKMAGLGPVKTKAITEWATNADNQVFCERLYSAGVRPTAIAVQTNTGGKLNGIFFCLTGTMAMGSRKFVEEKLVALGAVALDGVKKECNLVIVGTDAGSKVEKAKAKGIKIVGEDWVVNALKN